MKLNNITIKNSYMPLLWLMAPWLYFIEFNQYGFAHSETWLSFIPLLLLVLPFVVVANNTFWKCLLFPLLIVLSLSFLPFFKQPLWLLSAYFLSLLLIITLEEDFIKIAGLTAGIFIVTLLFLPMPTQQSNVVNTQFKQSEPNKNLAPIIHLILDEHIGMARLNADKATQAAGQQLTHFYLHQGFYIYNQAYSHYAHTYNSLPNLLNFSNHALDNDYFNQSLNNQRSLNNNQYFNRLAQLGYQFRVYESDYMDFCHSKNIPIASCYIYPAASVKNIQALPISVSEKSIFLLKSFLMYSSLYDTIFKFYQYEVRPLAQTMGLNFPAWNWYQARTSTIPFIETLQTIGHDVQQHPNGTVFFAHVLAPHNPYSYDENCNPIQPSYSWQIDVGPFPNINTEHSYAKRYHLYTKQLGCVQKQLDNLFSGLKHDGIYDKAIIIVHGDHGSRIILHEPASYNTQELTHQDYLDTYSTLFAVKYPQKSAGVSEEQLALEQLLQRYLQFINPEEKPAAINSAPYVYLFTAPGKEMVAYPLPRNRSKL